MERSLQILQEHWLQKKLPLLATVIAWMTMCASPNYWWNQCRWSDNVNTVVWNISVNNLHLHNVTGSDNLQSVLCPSKWINIAYLRSGECSGWGSTTVHAFWCCAVQAALPVPSLVEIVWFIIRRVQWHHIAMHSDFSCISSDQCVRALSCRSTLSVATHILVCPHPDSGMWREVASFPFLCITFCSFCELSISFCEHFFISCFKSEFHPHPWICLIRLRYYDFLPILLLGSGSVC